MRHNGAVPARILLAAAIAVLLAACGDDEPARRSATPAATSTATASAADPCLDAAADLPAQVSIPDGGPRPAPLLLAFHGLGDTASNFEASITLDPFAAERGLVVAYQDAANDHEWLGDEQSAEQDLATTREIIDGLVDAGCADPERVYLTGFSNGAEYAAHAGCELADRIAAMAPVAGAYVHPYPCPRDGLPIPLLEIHGDQDHWARTVPRLMRLWFARNDCPRAPERVQAGGVTTDRWPDCDVMRVTLAGTGHAWFGDLAVKGPDPTGFSASRAVVSFLLAHRRTGQRPMG